MCRSSCPSAAMIMRALVCWDGIKEKIPNLSYNLFDKSGHYAPLESESFSIKNSSGGSRATET